MSNDIKISACIDEIIYNIKWGKGNVDQNTVNITAKRYELKEGDLPELYKKLSDIGIKVVMEESKINTLLKKYI